MIRQELSEQAIILNLLDTRVYHQLLESPYEIDSFLSVHPEKNIVVIDEVQRIPELLNEVHRLIEEKGYRFLLTGSSAKKLRAKGVNLLAGRAWEANMFPLICHEIPNFDLERYLLYGGLPSIYSSDYPEEELHAYIKTYLQEEIQAEAFVRKVPAFSRFMKFAALTSGSVLNFSELSNDAGVSIITVREYYQILEDTFLGFTVPAWQKTQKRKPVSTAKFYFFDTGVRRVLTEIDSLPRQSDVYGHAFEHFIAMELRAFLSYTRAHVTLSYWRSKYGHEVDFIIGDHIAIEVKSTNKVQDKHLKNLVLLQEENICQQYYLISHDPLERKKNGVHIIHWKDFLEYIYANKISL